MNWYVKQAKRLIVAVIGLTVVLLGVILIFTPGPAIIVIPLGLFILASEFVWARRLLKKLRNQFPKKQRMKAKEWLEKKFRR